MSRRQQQLVRILEESGEWVIGRELAVMLGVSDRTIRSDVAAVNSFYQKSLIESDRRRGYRSSRQRACAKKEERGRVPKNSKERCDYLLRALLFNKKEVNLILLQSRLYASDCSIEQDIRRIKKLLEEWPDLELVRTAKHLRLRGSENSKRKLYRKMLTEETKGNFLNLNNLAALFGNFDLLEVKRVLDTVLDKYGYQVREVAVPMLMLHIGVSIERILEKNYVQTDIGRDKIQGSREYAIAEQFFEKVGGRFHVPVILDEIVFLAWFLLERNGERIKGEADVDWLVADILENIYLTFDIDFRGDPELKNGLGIHLCYMLDRIRQAGGISNVCLQEIKGKYPLVFEMGCHVARVIEERMELEVNENEIGFIALHLGCAYERLNCSKRYRVLLISPYNRGLLSLCMDKINLLFKDRMEIAGCLTMFEKSAVREKKPDLLVTTSPLEHDLKIPTVSVSLLMNQEDESRIFRALCALDGERFREKYMQRITSIIRPEFFFTDLELETPEEIISFLCDRLDENGYLPSGFKESVLSRERLSATSFSCRFAIPHSLELCSLRSVFPVALLKKAVAWGEYEVKMVILLAISARDRELMRIFFDWLGNMAGDLKRLALLVESRDRDSFVRILEHMGE